METGKAYIVRKNIFKRSVGQILTLKRCGYQAYFDEYNFVFIIIGQKRRHFQKMKSMKDV